MMRSLTANLKVLSSTSEETRFRVLYNFPTEGYMQLKAAYVSLPTIIRVAVGTTVAERPNGKGFTPDTNAL